MKYEDEENDAREDLGSFSKPSKKTPLSPYRHYGPAKVYDRDPDEIIEERKKSLLPLLEGLKKDAELVKEIGACIQIKILGFTYDFWISSNTYYDHATNRYEYGIEEICQELQRKIDDFSMGGDLNKIK